MTRTTQNSGFQVWTSKLTVYRIIQEFVMKNRNIIRRLRYSFYEKLPFPRIDYIKNVEIDVVVPVIEKDLPILPLCLEGVRKNVAHQIKDIYIIAPENETIRSFCKEHGLVFVEEGDVLGLSPKDIHLIAFKNGKEINRSGWLFQQILKLSGMVGTCENYLCIDADHILIRKHVFIDKDGVPIFYMSSENHKPYYSNISRLTGLDSFSSLSYIAHKMIFNKKRLGDLHALIEQRNGKCWIQAIIDNYDRKESSGFSEFELYGTFTKIKRQRPWRQYTMNYSQLDTYDNLERLYSEKYYSVTFPEYYVK